MLMILTISKHNCFLVMRKLCLLTFWIQLIEYQIYGNNVKICILLTNCCLITLLLEYTMSTGTLTHTYTHQHTHIYTYKHTHIHTPTHTHILPEQYT